MLSRAPPGAEDRLQRRELGRPLPKEVPEALASMAVVALGGALPPCSLSSELSA